MSSVVTRAYSKNENENALVYFRQISTKDVDCLQNSIESKCIVISLDKEIFESLYRFDALV
jgi:hypothetical protein